MDTKNSPYRTSISMTNVSSPIAESTHLNRSKSNSNYKFLWGGKISPAQKNSTISNTNNKNNKMNSTIKPTKMHPVNKIIDPRIYTDIHSKGLTSRIVKYHEDSFKLNRSLSAGSLYNKPGQFPIVHLHKNQIQYKANRNRPASVVRIAPPDKAVFHANTRSSILRTSSIVPTVNIKKANSDLSCENRPILHPADSDLMPTRSVLDALREISRKRINSDDLDGNDVIKKYCKETEDISLDIHSNNGNNFNSSAMKRQREIQQLSPNSQLSNSATEQIIKKRMYTRNNDISSSLSSSIRMLTNPKRRLGDILNNHSSASENSISPKAKHHCNEHENYEQNSQDKPNLNTLQSQPSPGMVNQITSLPTTTHVDEQCNKPKEVQQIASKDILQISTTTSTPTTTITSKYNSIGNINQKPKLTLFNKNYDDEDFKKKLDSRRILREREEYNEKNNRVGNMKFVKPRDISFAQLEKNPIIEKMKQSRLALMLKGLKGELNEVGDEDNDNDEDEIDIPQKQKSPTIQSEGTSTNNVSENENPPVSSTKPIVAVATTSASMSFATNTTASTSLIASPAIAVNPKMFSLQQEQKQTSFTDATNKDNATTTTTVSHSFGLKPNIPNSTVLVSPSSGSTSGLTTLTSSTTTATTSTSGGFSFGLNVTQNSNASVGGVITTVNSDANSPTTALTFTSDSNKATGFAFGASTNVVNSTGKAISTGFSFPTKTTIDSANVPISQNNQFSFTANQQAGNLLSTQNKSAFVPVSESANQKTIETFNQQQIVQTTMSKNYNTTSNVIFGNSPSNNAQSGTVPTAAIAPTSATKTVLSSQPSLFNFAGSASSNAQEKSQNSTFGNFSNNPPSSSITATSTSLPTFGSNVTEKNNFNFSSQASNTNNTISPFGNSTKSNFAFNSTNNSAEVPKTTNLFENKSPAGFRFTGVSESKSSEINSSSTKPFSFGSTPASSVEGFSFKNSTTPAITTTIPTSSQFSFTNTNNNQNDGASSFTPNAFPNAGNQFQNSNTTFNFGAVTKPSDASKSFNFNTSNQPQTVSNTTNPVFPFGGGTTSVENNPAPFSFSSNQTAANTKGFSFGNTSSQNKLDSSSSTVSKNTAGGFSFNNPSTNTNKTSGFGTFSLQNSTAPEQQTQSNQLSNNKFSFSSNLSNNTTVNNGQNPLFGGTASLGQSKSFNFGSNSTQNVFGGLSSTTPSTTTSMFGSVDSQLVKTTSAFTFGSSTASVNQPQQQQQQQQQQHQQQTSNVPFSFGTSSNNNANTNLFASNPNTVNKQSTFNFSTTASNNNLINSPTPATQNMTNSTNLFLGQGNGGRQIRKATRRLNKNS